MPKKYKNKYRIDSTRLQTWDYGWNGAYFVTINCKDRIRYFGDVSKGTMNLSKIGKIAETCWSSIPQHFPFVKLGAHIIMPDHVHGIIIIDKKVENTFDHKTQEVASPVRKNKFGPQSKNLASIVRGFKVGVTKNSRLINSEFSWQSRYYDSIIFNDASYRRVTKYIQDNPINWRG